MKILVIGDPHGKLPKNLDNLIKNYNPELIVCTGDIGKADLARKRAFENIKRKNQGLEEKEETSEEVKKSMMRYTFPPLIF